MRLYASTNYRLARLPFGARLFYTLFLVLVAAGMATCLAFMFVKSGLSAAELAEYYRQEDLGLGGKSFLELLETAHFHLFSMPIFFLVLGHIFFLSDWPERAKTWVILASFVAVVAEIALPFLIVYHTGAWAPLKHLSRVLLMATFAIYIAVPLKEMWWDSRNEEPEF